MPDYNNSKIYCIRAPGTDDIYIGSTTRPLSERMAEHRKHYRMWGEGKHDYLSSFVLIDIEGAYIELIENYPCDTKEQLNRREGELIRTTNNCINKRIAGRTCKDYYNDTREKRLEIAKNYREQNHDIIKEQHKTYYQNNRHKWNKKNNVTTAIPN